MTQIDADRSDPSTWTEPVVRVLGSADATLIEAINAPRLTDAIDAVVGVGRWQRLGGYGSFPIRFPSLVDPEDAGWHVDGSFERGPEPPPWNLHVNLRSRGRALLLLMLFSDVTEDDAPTRIRVGSHLDTAATLARADPDDGLATSTSATRSWCTPRRGPTVAIIRGSSASPASTTHPAPTSSTSHDPTSSSRPANGRSSQE